MAIKMDGAVVEINDQVYVLLHGMGTVTGIRSNGSIQIRTARGETQYPPSAYTGKDKRVYWHDPFLVVPPKHKLLWRGFRDLAIALFDNLLALFNTGQVGKAAKAGSKDKEI